MLIYPRDRLAYPAGRRPGINYGHIAFNEAIGLSTASIRFLSTIASSQGVLKPLNKPGVLVGQGAGGTSTFVLDPVIGLTTSFSRTVGFFNSYALSFPTTAPTSQTFGMILTLNTAIGATQNCGLCYDSAAADSNCQGFVLGQSANGLAWERNSFTSSSTSNLGALTVNTPYFVAASVNVNTQNYIQMNMITGRYVSATITGAITFAAGSASWSMGGLSANSVSSGCNIACGYLAENVYLSANQLLEWSRDPWAFWYPYDELNNRSSTFIFETIQAPQGLPPGGGRHTELPPAWFIAGRAPSYGTLSTRGYADAGKPFKQDDWPNPIPPFRPQFSYDLPITAPRFPVNNPFFQTEWPLPIPPFRPQVSSDLGSTQRLATIMAPNALRDWPLPIPPFRPQVSADLGATQRLATIQSPFAFSQDLPLPPFRPQVSADQPAQLWQLNAIKAPITGPTQDLPIPPFRPQFSADQSMSIQRQILIKPPITGPTQDLPTQPFRPQFSFDAIPATFITITVTVPRNQYDWPLPIGPQWQRYGLIYNKAQQSGLQPFAQTEWPLPIQSFRPQFSFDQGNASVLTVTVTAPRNQYDWPLPIQPFRPQFSYDLRSQAPFAKPFSQTEWPLTPPPSRLDQNYAQWFNPAQMITGQKPFLQTEWPLSIPLFRPDFSFTPSAPLWLAPAVVMPRNQYDWPLPIAPPRPDFNYTFYYVFAQDIIGAFQPFAQYDWPLPQQPFRPDFAYMPPAPVWLTPVVMPKNQYDWPLIPGAVQFNRSFDLAGTVRLTQGTKPFAQTDWPNPIPPSWRLYGSQYAAQIFQILTPFNQYDWPLPIPPFRPQFSYELPMGPILFPSPQPLNQYDWPLPQAPFRPQFSLDFGPSALLLFVPPFPRNQYDWPLPIPRFRPDFWTSFNYNPTQMQAGQKPFAQTEWPLTPPYPSLPVSFYQIGGPNNNSLYVQPPPSTVKIEWLIRARRRGRR